MALVRYCSAVAIILPRQNDNLNDKIVHKNVAFEEKVMRDLTSNNIFKSFKSKGKITEKKI